MRPRNWVSLIPLLPKGESKNVSTASAEPENLPKAESGISPKAETEIVSTAAAIPESQKV